MNVLYFLIYSFTPEQLQKTVVQLNAIMTPISLSTKRVDEALVEYTTETITCQKHRVAVASTVG